MARDPRDKYGEYGGGPGSIHTEEEGHTDLTAAEKRRITSTYGIRNSDAPVDDPKAVEVGSGVDADGTAWEDAEQRRRALRLAESRRRVNGRGVGDAL